MAPLRRKPKNGSPNRTTCRRPKSSAPAAAPPSGRTSTASSTNRSGNRPTACGFAADEIRRGSRVRPKSVFAYDDRFLYLAIHCPKAKDVDYSPDDRPRPRDADLSAHDRVTVRLDVDRDYTTAFELAVDHRGWTHDACWSDATWNPTWFVAAAADEATWTVEAAIPLAELVAEPPAASTSGPRRVVRTIPRVGYETWSGDATSDDSPDQFGLLIFE